MGELLILLGGHVIGVGVAQSSQYLIQGVQGQDTLGDLVHIVVPQQLPGLVQGEGGGGSGGQGEGEAESQQSGQKFMFHGVLLMDTRRMPKRHPACET